MKPSRTLWGSWAQELFYSASLNSMSYKGQIQTVANQRREGMQRQGRSSQETIVQGPGRVLVCLKGYMKQHPLAVYRTSGSLPTNGRCQHSPLQRRPPETRLKELEELIKRLPEIRLKEWRPCTYPKPHL